MHQNIYHTNCVGLSLHLIFASLHVEMCVFKNHFKKLGQLIVRKIIEIIATRYQGLKCTKKIDFGCGSAPDPAGGA